MRRAGNEIKTNPLVETDWAGREYIKICRLITESIQNQDGLDQEIEKLIVRFFELFDEYTEIETRTENDMIEIYNELAIDDFGVMYI